MRILLTNDDGLHAEGIQALYAALAPWGEITVAAPMRECSAGGHAISTATAIPVRQVPFGQGGSAYAVDGTPADCVKLALAHLMKHRPDVVVSGINHGANVGVCVLYSGTVSAALEGAIEGLPAFAVSALMRRGRQPDFDAIARRFKTLAEEILADGVQPGLVYNVNFPDRSVSRLKAVRWAPQSRSVPFGGHFVRRRDPRGRPYYWLLEKPHPTNGEKATDVALLVKGHVTVTPLGCDMTRHEALRRRRRPRPTKPGGKKRG